MVPYDLKNEHRIIRKSTMAHRILIADNDHFYRKVLFEAFEKKKYEIFTALDGSDAIKLIARMTFQIAIIEYHLPGKKGDQILESMRTKYIDVPVIVVTSDDSLEIERRVRSYGPAYFFVKPFSINDMCNVVNKILTPKSVG